MRPIQAITTCLRKAFDFSGRASPSEFWWFAPFIIILTAFILSSDRIMTLFPLQVGVLGSILLVLFIVPFPLYAALVRRFRDAGLWPLLPLSLPVWIIAGPQIAIIVDASQFGLRSMTRGMPELVYAGLGYLILAAMILGNAMRPSRNSPTHTRDNEVTP